MWFWKKSTKNYPSFYREYIEKIQDEGYSNNIASIDLETSSLIKKSADILSFGGVLIEEAKIRPKNSIHYFFKSNKKLHSSTHIHEILPAKSAPKFSDRLPEILSYLDNHQILGHFVQFDVGLINRELIKYGLPKLKNPVIDTLSLALKYDGIINLSYADKEKYTLFNLSQRFNLDMQQSHDALEDAFITALLYLHLKN